MSTTRSYGWKRGLPSHPDSYLLVAHPQVASTFPKQKFLPSTYMPPVYDQGQLGSCTANALSGAFEYMQKQEGLEDFMPSRLFIYYNERSLENNVLTDSGASLDDGIKTLSTQGVCSETIWPYNISQFSTKPLAQAYTLATAHQVLASKRVPTSIDGFRTMINMGYPVAFGFTVYASFESQTTANTGIVKLPAANEQVLGGHAVVCVGYSDTMKSANGKTVGYLKIRNSWGDQWGQAGYCWMPYAYLTSLGLISDMWVITKNEDSLVSLNKKLSKPVA